jgi:hypothetical protein
VSTVEEEEPPDEEEEEEGNQMCSEGVNLINLPLGDGCVKIDGGCWCRLILPSFKYTNVPSPNASSLAHPANICLSYALTPFYAPVPA